MPRGGRWAPRCPPCLTCTERSFTGVRSVFPHGKRCSSSMFVVLFFLALLCRILWKQQSSWTLLRVRCPTSESKEWDKPNFPRIKCGKELQLPKVKRRTLHAPFSALLDFKGLDLPRALKGNIREGGKGIAENLPPLFPPSFSPSLPLSLPLIRYSPITLTRYLSRFYLRAPSPTEPPWVNAWDWQQYCSACEQFVVYACFLVSFFAMTCLLNS